MSNVVNARIAADAQRLYEERRAKQDRKEVRRARFLAELAKHPIRIETMGRGR